MSNLGRNFNRFMVRNRNKGVPKLMLWIGIVNVVFYILFSFLQNMTLTAALSYNAAYICRGEIWRLFTYPLTSWMAFIGQDFGLGKLLLSCYVWYWTGSVVEGVWGRLKANLYYLTGVLLSGIAGLVLYLAFHLSIPMFALYLNSSLFLVVATLIPENRVLAFYFIPMKMRWMALICIAIDVFYIVRDVMAYTQYLGLGFAVAAVATEAIISFVVYLIFLWNQAGNLFGRRVNRYAPPRPPRQPAGNPGRTSRSTGQSYHHKCTVCGRTDVDCPGLEFRYCSKCKGYFCYCIDHINNHDHVQ